MEGRATVAGEKNENAGIVARSMALRCDTILFFFAIAELPAVFCCETASFSVRFDWLIIVSIRQTFHASRRVCKLIKYHRARV